MVRLRRMFVPILTGIIGGATLATFAAPTPARANSNCTCANELTGYYECAASLQECVPGSYICHIECDS